LKNILYTV